MIISRSESFKYIDVPQTNRSNSIGYRRDFPSKHRLAIRLTTDPWKSARPKTRKSYLIFSLPPPPPQERWLGARNGSRDSRIGRIALTRRRRPLHDSSVRSGISPQSEFDVFSPWRVCRTLDRESPILISFRRSRRGRSVGIAGSIVHLCAG